MNYSEKHNLLAQYLDVAVDEIIEMSPSSYEYEGDEYMILDDNELDDAIKNQVDSIADEVKYSIDLQQDHLDYCYYIDMKIDYVAIREDVESNIADYIGTGTYEEFDGYYIFLMQ